MAVSPSRRQFVSPSSQQMAVSFNRRQFAHFPSPAVSKWQSLSAEDSLLTFSQQGLQMAVSPSRRQFVPLSDWQMAVFSQEKTVCLLNTQRDRQMAVSSNSLSVSGMFSSPQSQRMAVFLLGKQFVDSPGTSRRMAVFTLKTVRPPSNKVIIPSKERGPI